MKFEKAITILYSTDITRSIKYYTEILGFEDHWEWDNPPTFLLMVSYLVWVTFATFLNYTLFMLNR